MSTPELFGDGHQLPAAITRTQLAAACDVLGFDPKVTAGFNLRIFVGSESVTVAQYAQIDGKTQIVGNVAAVNTFHIPVEGESDPEALREVASRLLTAANEAEAAA